MGKRIHVAKKYEVEYSSSACSNYKYGEFKDFLEELQPNNGWIIVGEEYSDEFEVDKNVFKRCIKVLELIVNADEMEFTELVKELNDATSKEDCAGYFDENYKADYEDYVNVITDLAKSAGFNTLESALEQLKSFYRICDKKYTSLHFYSF